MLAFPVSDHAAIPATPDMTSMASNQVLTEHATATSATTPEAVTLLYINGETDIFQ